MLAANLHLSLFGVHDVLSAAHAAKFCEGLLVSSSSFAASYYGLPDVGLVAWQDLVAFVQRIRTVLPEQQLVVDIEDGFGHATITSHVARELQRAGASAVVLHDTGSARELVANVNSILPTDQFVVKVQEVKRTCPELFLITGVHSTELREVERCAKEYEKVGADAILFGAPDSVADVSWLAGKLSKPLQVNIPTSKDVDWGLEQLVAAGASVVGFPELTLYAAHQQLEQTLSECSSNTAQVRSLYSSSFESCENHLLANLQRAEGAKTDGASVSIVNESALDEGGVRKGALSSIQERMWFLHNFEEDKTIYNLGAAMEVKGRINRDFLQQAFQTIVDRHECLRTVFRMDSDRPVQIVHENVPVEVQHESLLGLDSAEQESILREHKEFLKKRVFNLEQAPLVELYLVSLSETRHEMLYLTHHLVSDGWSISTFFNELSECYLALSEGRVPVLPELKAQYSDYVLFEQKQLAAPEMKSDLQYWLDKLSGDLPVLELPTDRPRPVHQTFSGSSENYQLPAALAAKLKEMSKQEGATLFMTLLAAFEVLLKRYSNAEEVCIGVPIAERNRSDFEKLIGPLINTLVIRNDLSGTKSFSELLREVRNEALESFEHHSVPFEQIVSELSPKREMSRSPVYQALFSFRNFPERPFEIGDLTLSPIEFERPTSKFDITLELVENGDGILALFEYNTDLFDRSTIQRMHQQYEQILAAAVADPTQAIETIQVLPQDELRTLLVDWNDTDRGYDLDRSIHSLFEEQALKTPTDIALVADEERLSYAELNARSNKLAHFLLEKGVQAETRVGVFMERTADMVVAMIGILKAGGAYVPLDAAYPKSRIALIVEDAELPVIVTDDSLIEQLPDSSAQIVSMDQERGNLQELSSTNPVVPVTGSNLVYVFYTSGSTGRPKGVALEHSNPVALCLWAQELFSPEEIAGVLFSTSICFDLSVFELFFTLSSGGKVILAPNALALPGLAARKEVTLVNTVPSIMAEVVKVGAIPENCQTVTLCGEPLSGELVDDIYKSPQVKKVYDLYGPSEDTTYSTVVLRKPQGPVTIGKPISETQAFVLDKNLQPVPIGVPGELHLSGAGIARGYLGRPDLTSEKFIPSPFSDDPESRMYKTGDLVRWLANGTLEFLGRIDFQVKIRGFRIELGEIEAAIRKLSAVREAIVMAQPTNRGDKQLVAYVVYGDFELTVSELKHTLGQTLPEYMVPAVVVELEEFPLTPNGKIDRKALPNPQEGDVAQESSAVSQDPGTDAELVIAAIWKEVLGVPEVRANDNFFDLGGHSLLSMRVLVRIEEQLGVSLTPRDIILQTLRQLASHVEGEGGATVVDEDKEPAASEVDSSSLADQVERMADQERPINGIRAKLDRVRQWRARL
jgi:amino acid adenylation domain-containing protein